MRRETMKRKLLRHIPILSGVAKELDALENQNQQLQELVGQFQQLRNQPLSVSVDHSADQLETGGLPLPPPLLRYWVSGTQDPHWFLESGKRGVQTLVEILARQRITLDQLEQILDFGCGCGRVIRHLGEYETVKLHGTDYNKTAIVWCDENLNFAEFGSNLMEPPTRYRTHSFDLIYAFSVFTHLIEPLQQLWMIELCRILRPNGYLIITVHGDHYIPQLAKSEQIKYRQGQVVVLQQDLVGQNECAAFHPESYVRNVLAQDFDVIDFLPQGAWGNPYQDAYLLKSRG